MSIDWAGSTATVAAAIRARGVESDLSDAALVDVANAARGEIAARIGSTHEGLVRYPLGGSSIVSVSPPISSVDTVTENGITLTEGTDYRIRGGGTFLERIELGYSRLWGSNIVITYDGSAPGDRYDRVVIDLVKLALEYTGLDSRRDGDYSEEGAGTRGGGLNSYQMQREQIISELYADTAGFA
jgi:hypothetical protein